MSVAGSRAALCGGGMVGLIELRKPDSSLSVTEGLPVPGMMVCADNYSLLKCCLTSLAHDECEAQLVIIIFGNLPCMCDKLSKPESNWLLSRSPQTVHIREQQASHSIRRPSATLLQ